MPPVNEEEMSSVVLPIWATTKVESMIVLELGNLINPCANHKLTEENAQDSHGDNSTNGTDSSHDDDEDDAEYEAKADGREWNLNESLDVHASP